MIRKGFYRNAPKWVGMDDWYENPYPMIVPYYKVEGFEMESRPGYWLPLPRPVVRIFDNYRKAKNFVSKQAREYAHFLHYEPPGSPLSPQEKEWRANLLLTEFPTIPFVEPISEEEYTLLYGQMSGGAFKPDFGFFPSHTTSGTKIPKYDPRGMVSKMERRHKIREAARREAELEEFKDELLRRVRKGEITRDDASKEAFEWQAQRAKRRTKERKEGFSELEDLPTRLPEGSKKKFGDIIKPEFTLSDSDLGERHREADIRQIDEEDRERRERRHPLDTYIDSRGQRRKYKQNPTKEVVIGLGLNEDAAKGWPQGRCMVSVPGMVSGGVRAYEVKDRDHLNWNIGMMSAIFSSSLNVQGVGEAEKFFHKLYSGKYAYQVDGHEVIVTMRTRGGLKPPSKGHMGGPIPSAEDLEGWVQNPFIGNPKLSLHEWWNEVTAWIRKLTKAYPYEVQAQMRYDLDITGQPRAEFYDMWTRNLSPEDTVELIYGYKGYHGKYRPSPSVQKKMAKLDPRGYGDRLVFPGVMDTPEPKPPPTAPAKTSWIPVYTSWRGRSPGDGARMVGAGDSVAVYHPGSRGYTATSMSPEPKWVTDYLQAGFYFKSKDGGVGSIGIVEARPRNRPHDKTVTVRFTGGDQTRWFNIPPKFLYLTRASLTDSSKTGYMPLDA